MAEVKNLGSELRKLRRSQSAAATSVKEMDEMKNNVCVMRDRIDELEKKAAILEESARSSRNVEESLLGDLESLLCRPGPEAIGMTL